MIVAVSVTGVPNGDDPGVAVRAVVVAIGVTGGETLKVADSMIPPPGLALPTATTVPLLRVATPVKASWLVPGFTLVTVVQLVPFHCSAAVPKPVVSPFVLEKLVPTAKMLLAEKPEMADRVALGEATWDQVAPLKFQMPAPPTTQTSLGAIASTAFVAALPTIWALGDAPRRAGEL